MGRKGNRQLVYMVNKSTGTTYTTTRNRVNKPDKHELKKFDPKTGKHEVFVEDSKRSKKRK